MVLRTNKPQGKSFKRWVTNEVLPSIRRCGILELLDDGRATDVDSEVDEAPDDKPRRVIQKACASKRSVSDSGSLPESCANVSRKRACVSEHLESDCGLPAVVVAGFDLAGAREFDEPLPRPEQFTAVVNACRRFLDYTAKNENLRAVVERHGLYRTLSKCLPGGGEEKNLRSLCFTRGGRDAMIRYGGI